MIGGVRVTTSYIASLHDTCVLITKTLKIFFYSSSGAPTTTLLAHANESSPIIQNRPNPAVAPCDRRWMWCQLRAQVNRVGIQRVRIEGERRRDLRTRYRLRKDERLFTYPAREPGQGLHRGHHAHRHHVVHGLGNEHLGDLAHRGDIFW